MKKYWINGLLSRLGSQRTAARWLRLIAVFLTLQPLLSWADLAKLAPGFKTLPRNATVLLAPLDVELFSLTMGGVLEPKADWSAAAMTHMSAAMRQKMQGMGLQLIALDDAKADELAEQLHLHAAVARSISLHHQKNPSWTLPTKKGQLDWSFGETMRPLAAQTGAKYALFTWVRDSYANTQRKAASLVLAALGYISVPSGIQAGYASLVDLESGRVLWFNQLVRASGDLRSASSAAESTHLLLEGFPSSK